MEFNEATVKEAIKYGQFLKKSKEDIAEAIDLYVMPTGMEEAPKAALDIHCLRRGGGVALTPMIN